MYNGQVINLLLKERGLRAKDLLEYLQLQTNGSITSLVKGNPSAERLEKIADFFDVPIDRLFKRAKSYGCNVNESSIDVTSITIGELKGKVQAQDRIIEEKDKRIALLEDMIALLKQQSDTSKS